MTPSPGPNFLETWTSSRHETLFLPGGKQGPGESRTADSRGDPSLAPDLREKATQRLRITALVYAGAFFFADLFPSLLTGEIARRFDHPRDWIPTVLSIALGLAVAASASNPRLGWNARVNLGLAFEVAGSLGIAVAMFLGLSSEPVTVHMIHMLQPSWIAIWMIFYSVLVPAPPGRALLAAIASGATAPTVVYFAAPAARSMPPLEYFFVMIFPYMICVAMAYVGARVVYQLGKDVTRARELGSYRMEERLGSGGMGEVWRASHRLLARPAAIKFVRPESLAGSNPEEARLLLKRFELEARATALLTSVHTISLYDFGVTDGSFYYVMELLDGLDLDRLVARFGPVPPARLVHLLSQACDSLDEAHGKGLIHRDVKPANIYACRVGNRCDFVKVLDFGLVTRSRHEDTETRLTRPQQATGTPAYMSPEMARGEDVDGRSDLYALGCVAHWLATGRHVFTGTTVYDIVSQHLSAAPEPASLHAPDLPRELDEVILKCLEKRPERRPAGARELARRLHAVPLRDRWGDEEAEAWWQAHLPADTPERVVERTREAGPTAARSG